MKGKKQKAIDIVKRKLEKFAKWNKYGIPTVEDRIPSFTTSILTVSSDMHIDNSQHIKILAITEWEEDMDEYLKTKSMISALEDPEKNAIEIYYDDEFDSYDFMLKKQRELTFNNGINLNFFLL